jgi:hypothetical protein
VCASLTGSDATACSRPPSYAFSVHWGATQCHTVADGGPWQQSLSMVAILAAAPTALRGEMLTPSDLRNLIAVGNEGTTIVFEGGAQRSYFSARLKNTARKSQELGLSFMQQHVQPDTITEGVFVSSIENKGKVRLISGFAGIAADRETGSGILVLLQTFQTDKSLGAFQSKDRLFAVMMVDEVGPTFQCKRSEWIKMSAAKTGPKFKSGPCEFVVGNVVAANSVGK